MDVFVYKTAYIKTNEVFGLENACYVPVELNALPEWRDRYRYNLKRAKEAAKKNQTLI